MTDDLTAAATGDLTGARILFQTHVFLSSIQSSAVYDDDELWTEELMEVNKDRLFGCYIYKMPGGDDEVTVNGSYPFPITSRDINSWVQGYSPATPTPSSLP